MTKSVGRLSTGKQRKKNCGVKEWVLKDNNGGTDRGDPDWGDEFN